MQKYNNKKRNTDNYKNSNKKYNKKKKSYKRHKRNEIRGLVVVPYDDESIEQLIRRFRKVVDSAGVMRELRRREFYMTRSQKRREKKKRALKRLRKRERTVNRGQRE